MKNMTILRFGMIACLLAPSAAPTVLAGGVVSHPANEEGRGTIYSVEGGSIFPRLDNASVDVKVGSTSFSGLTDQNGFYSVNFSCTDPDDLVTVYVKGVDDQAGLAAARVISSCQYMLDHADSGGVYRTGEVSPVSTAVYAVLRWLVADEDSLSWPLSHGELQEIARTLQLYHVNTTLLALASVSLGDIDLPDGVANTVELVLDRNVLADTITQVMTDVSLERRNTVARMIQFNNRIYKPGSEISELQRIIGSCPNLLSSCPFAVNIHDLTSSHYGYLYDGGSAVLEFRDLQDLIFVEDFTVPDDNLRAVRVSLETEEPLFSTTFTMYDSELGEFISARHDTFWIDLRVADASEAIPLISRFFYTVRTFPDNPEKEDEVASSVVPGFMGASLSAGAPVFTSPAVGDQWVVQFGLDNPQAIHSGYDRVTFQGEGVALTERQAETVNWQFENGHLVIDGDQVAQHRYYRLGGLQDRHQPTLLLVDQNTETMRHRDSQIVEVDAGVSFTATNAAGRYINAGADLEPAFFHSSGERPASGFVFHLSENGTGWRALIEDHLAWIEDPQKAKPDNADNLTWSIDEFDRIVIQRETSSGSFVWEAWEAVAADAGFESIHIIRNGTYFEDETFEVPYEPGLLWWMKRVDLVE